MRRSEIAGWASLATMPLTATALGAWLVAEKAWSLPRAAFTGALGGVMAVVLFWSAYRVWAEAWCGAPFEVGDTVRVARGGHRGSVGRITRVLQGLDVEVELPASDGFIASVHSWGELRRQHGPCDVSGPSHPPPPPSRRG